MAVNLSVGGPWFCRTPDYTAGLPAKFDFLNFKTLCDVGGATGLLCIEVANKHPHLRCTSFDLPPVEPIAQRHIAAAGLSDRIGTASGDFFKDPLPKADIITMGVIP
jgi:hypothetical protein